MQVLKANLASLGVVKTLPYLAMFATSNLGGWVGDYLIHRRRVPTARARKTVNTLGKFMAAAELNLELIEHVASLQCMSWLGRWSCLRGMVRLC